MGRYASCLFASMKLRKLRSGRKNARKFHERRGLDIVDQFNICSLGFCKQFRHLFFRSNELIGNVSVNEQHAGEHEKIRANRNTVTATITSKGRGTHRFVETREGCNSSRSLRGLIELAFEITDMSTGQTDLNASRLMNPQVSAAVTQTSNRLTPQNSPHGMPNNGLHSIGQPYLGDTSNFGPFYHHHGHHHMPSYGNPYDKYKTHHTRSPNTSPYDTYQGFYSPPTHHQIVRPNGYIDLMPR